MYKHQLNECVRGCVDSCSHHKAKKPQYDSRAARMPRNHMTPYDKLMHYIKPETSVELLSRQCKELTNKPEFKAKAEHDIITKFSDLQQDVQDIILCEDKFNKTTDIRESCPELRELFICNYAIRSPTDENITEYYHAWLHLLHIIEKRQQQGTSEKTILEMMAGITIRQEANESAYKFVSPGTYESTQNAQSSPGRYHHFVRSRRNPFANSYRNRFDHHSRYIAPYDIRGPFPYRSSFDDFVVGSPTNQVCSIEHLYLILNKYIPTLDEPLSQGKHLRDFRKALIKYADHPRYLLTAGAYAVLAKINAALSSLQYCFMGNDCYGEVRLFVVSINHQPTERANCDIVSFGCGALTLICTVVQMIQRQRLPDTGAYRIKDIQEPALINPLEKLIYIGLRKNINYEAYGILQRRPAKVFATHPQVK